MVIDKTTLIFTLIALYREKQTFQMFGTVASHVTPWGAVYFL
jgi:hypothetical protein